MNKKVEFTKILVLLAATFPKFAMNEGTTEAYYQLLSDISIDELRAAALQCARNCTFFPSVNEILTEIENIRCTMRGIPTAYEAWEDLIKAGKAYQRYAVMGTDGYKIQQDDYKFLHPLIKRVAEMLGWPKEFPGDSPGVDRAHYFKAYEIELKKMLNMDRMHPNVREFIEQSKSKQLEAGNGRHRKTETILEVQQRISGGIEGQRPG